MVTKLDKKEQIKFDNKFKATDKDEDGFISK
jgi:hypothetical protein